MISDLKHESMITPDGRHWRKVKDTVKQEFEVGDSLGLRKIWDLKLFDYK